MELFTDKMRIRNFLQKFLDRRALLTIKLNSHKQLFSSAVIKIDSDTETFLLDELKPEHGDKLIMQNPDIQIHGQLEGVSINFHSKVIEFGKEDNISFYKLPFPDTIEYNQRRQAVRIKLGDTHPLPIKFFLDNGQQLVGEIDDISIRGLRAKFSNDLSAHLERGQHLRCTFLLPPENKMTLDCDFIVSVVKYKQNHFSQPFIGGQFVNLKTPDERQLQNTIMSLQRALQQKTGL